MSEQNSLDVKAEQLKSLLKTFYHPDSDQSWDLQVLNKVIETLQTHFDNKDMVEAVSPEIISYWVKQGVAQKGVGQRFLVGAVNFCTLMPMRAVPFKVVCLLGLNDGDYPRSVQPIGFDLVSQSQRKKGDRSRKLDDRYLFLEALLSARKQLLLSYVGRSCYNNEPQVPSILVSELIDYIDRCFYIEGKACKPSTHLLNQATLQPFSSLNYIESDKQSFNPTWLISKATKEPQSNEDNTTLSEGLPNPFDTAEYELEGQNCTNFAVSAARTVGFNIPSSEVIGNYGIGSGATPGKFGSYLKNMNLPTGATRNKEPGNSPANKECP